MAAYANVTSFVVILVNLAIKSHSYTGSSSSQKLLLHLKSSANIHQYANMQSVGAWRRFAQSRSFKDAIKMVSGQFDGVEGDATMVDCVKSACGYSGALDHGTVKYTSIDMYSKLKDDHNRVPPILSSKLF